MATGFSQFILGIVKSDAFRMRQVPASAGRSGGQTLPSDRRAQRSMHFLIGKSLSRRTFVRGMGATFALPFLDAMIPIGRGAGRVRRGEQTRLVAIEMVHGAAGCNELGARLNLWAPAQIGTRSSTSHPRRSSSLEPYRDYLTIISNTDCRKAEPETDKEIGGDHFRSSAVYLTQSHPRQTEGSDVHVGASLDQMYAQRYGQETPIPSMQLCIENVDQAGGCAYGYACVYTDSISWASPTEPLPVIRDPRVAFEKLFGVGGTARGADGAPPNASQHPRLRGERDDVAQEHARHRRTADAWTSYLDDIREVERRIQRIEARNTSGEPRAIPEAPAGVPDSFEEHVELMFDLQALAFAADITRVFSFKMGRDGSSPAYPESGSDKPFHPASHHGGSEKGVKDFFADQQVSRGHAAVLPRQAEEHQRGGQQPARQDDDSCTARRWAIRTSTTIGAARSSPRRTRTARCPATCTSGRPTARRWRTRCSA